MMPGEEMLSEMKLRDKMITDCELVLECANSRYRLYVSRFENGFFAKAVEWCGSSGENINISAWLSDEVYVDEIFEITAYFDGVRHLEIKRSYEGEAGYLYYPDIQGIIKIFEKVRELEKEMCRDCEEDEDV